MSRAALTPPSLLRRRIDCAEELGTRTNEKSAGLQAHTSSGYFRELGGLIPEAAKENTSARAE